MEKDKSINKSGQLTIINNVGWAYGVPIYNDSYYDCADFKIGDEFDMHNFGLLCLDFAVKTDLKIMRDLRQIRNGSGVRSRKREFIKWNAGEIGFFIAVSDATYRKLFAECFIFKKKKHLRLVIDLRDYCKPKKLAKRHNNQFHMYKKHIRKDMKYRLYLLMRLAAKHVTFGVVQKPAFNAPWDKWLSMHIVSAANSNKRKSEFTNDSEPKKKRKLNETNDRKLFECIQSLKNLNKQLAKQKGESKKGMDHYKEGMFLYKAEMNNWKTKFTQLHSTIINANKE
eukprot:129593_1